MQFSTHQEISSKLCGQPIEIRPGYSSVLLKTIDEMRVDASRLVHGGFVFGLADYAAMLAVGDQNVVLGAADVRFFKPVIVAEDLVAEGIVRSTERPNTKKRLVDVTVKRSEELVFSGLFTCFVLERHVLEAGSNR